MPRRWKNEGKSLPTKRSRGGKRSRRLSAKLAGGKKKGKYAAKMAQRKRAPQDSKNEERT